LMPRKLRNILIVFLVVVILIATTKAAGLDIFIMKKMYPKTYSEYVFKYADEYGVDPLLVFAVIKAESNFKDSVVSNRNAKGVMQLMDKTAEEVAGNIMVEQGFRAEMLFDEKTNSKIGTKYLSELMEKYQNYYVAVAAYNAGIGTVDKWIQTGIIKPDGSDIENIPYKETNNYVRKIIRDYGIYTDLLLKVKMALLPDVILDYMIRSESAGNANLEKNIIYSGKISRTVLERELGIDTGRYPDTLFGMRESLEIKDVWAFLNAHLQLINEVIKANERVNKFEQAALLKALEEEWNLSLWMIRPNYNLSVLKQPVAEITTEKIREAVASLDKELPSKLVVYGTGKFCQRIIEKRGQCFLDKILCFCDSNLEKQGSEYFGKTIISPDRLEEISYDAVAVVSERFDVEIKEALLKRGIPEDKIIIL